VTIDPQFQRRLLAASGFAELSLFQEAVEEQVRAAPKIEQSKRIRVHALVSSSASVVPRLAQNPISGDVSHGAADKADNAGLNQLEITARPELPPKGTPEIFVSFAVRLPPVPISSALGGTAFVGRPGDLSSAFFDGGVRAAVGL
jgi:hypothetical protein